MAKEPMKKLTIMIPQSCLDHGIPLITRDRDFSSFQKFAGLRLPVTGDLLQ
jgi:predicted nucleic acid-binding protein